MSNPVPSIAPITRNFDRLLRALLILATAIVLVACGGGDGSSATQARYQSAVADVMARYQAPGAVVGVWVPSEPAWRMAVGLADVQSGRPMSLDEHFPIRSITKSFTVTALMQLERDGLLSLDDTVDAHVAGIPNGDRISLLQLAAMESGLAEYSASPDFLDVFIADFEHAFAPEELVAYGAAMSPRFEPGAQYEYSNTNTVLLGMVIERVAGAPLAEVLRERIFEPLGLSRTSYPTALPYPDPHASPHEADALAGVGEPLPHISPTALGASGAIVSTIDDLGTWGEALGKGSLLAPAQHALRIAQARPATNGPVYEAYGLGIGTLEGWWGHTGSGLGYQAAVFHHPETGATIAALVNSTPESSRFSRDDNIAQDLFSALAGVLRGD